MTDPGDRDPDEIADVADRLARASDFEFEIEWGALTDEERDEFMALVEQRKAHGDEAAEAIAEKVRILKLLFAWQQGAITTLGFVERVRGAVLDSVAQQDESPRDTARVMSQENVEAFKHATDAINRGDIEVFLPAVHPAVEFHAFMEELLGGEGRVYLGHAGVREFFRDFNEHFDELHWEYSDIRDLADRVLAIGTFRARGRMSGVEVETPIGVLVDYEYGLATRVLSTGDPDEALEAAGLSE
jgi:hypothetical protein